MAHVSPFWWTNDFYFFGSKRIIGTFISINFLESFLKINTNQFEIYYVRFQVGMFDVTKSTFAFISILIDTEKIQVQRCWVQRLGQQTLNKMCLVGSFRSLFMKMRQLSSFAFQFLVFVISKTLLWLFDQLNINLDQSNCNRLERLSAIAAHQVTRVSCFQGYV